jgi:hypothetical protein
MAFIPASLSTARETRSQSHVLDGGEDLCAKIVTVQCARRL